MAQPCEFGTTLSGHRFMWSFLTIFSFLTFDSGQACTACHGYAVVMSNTPHSHQHHRHPLLAEHFLPPINALSKNQPLRWLVLGFKDMAQAPGLSLLHGFVLALLGAVITALAHDRFWLLAGTLSGFWVVAPVLATSLYAMSRAMERQEAVNMGFWSTPGRNGKCVSVMRLAVTGA